MNGLHIRFEGLTASYPYPFLRSGTAISLPLPPYSSIFGMLSACAGYDIYPNGILIGFEFTSGERRSIDLERTDRLQTDQKGRLRTNPQQGISRREFHVYPKLDVYLSDRSLKPIFENPIATPRFGRSQDLAWISSVVEIDFTPVESGAVRATLVPYPDVPIGQILPPLVDYYFNDWERQTRVAARTSRYAAMPDPKPSHSLAISGFEVRATSRIRLYHPSDSTFQEHAIILMDFQS